MNFISTRRVVLRLLFSMLANQIVQANELEIFPEAENDEQVIEAGSTLTLTCINESPHHSSDNLTELRWILPQFKNPLIEETDKRFSLTDVKNETHLISTMTLINITTNDTGFYECQGRIQPRNRYVYVFSNEDFDLTGPPNLSSNKLEAKTSIFDPVTFLEEEKHEINVPTLTATLIGLCAFCVGIFGIKIHLDKRKAKRQLEKMLNGDPSRIDPEVPLEYQTEFLPYDRKWEFPRKRLRLGQELGSGCFGRVVKGEAVGIKDSDETVTTVAVKMTKLTAKSHNALDVLIRELKMMIHLWEHLNIVNLMGACTNTNIKEILVIIEFCKFGDLKSYFIKHRDQFINELNALGNMPPTNETAANDFTQHPLVAMKLVNEISELQSESTQTILF
ncbi:vascular endothelial growth factor receptor 1-like isoform X2 [Daphnia pulex]|uniref:vascular endothelial growth factor receptor 1-like isoform X2 n=1 Tax=Daphnia pulex TaxID=6669 RepID=UPI001EDD89D1|nr:vascular endothelial growth factor receptor 1-like isoform X2 [Daphnia pulex]